MSAAPCGTPLATIPAVYSASLTTTRVIGRPVSSVAIAATPAMSTASDAVRAVVTPSRPPSTRAIVAASARSAWVVQAPGPSCGMTSSPVCLAPERPSSIAAVDA